MNIQELHNRLIKKANMQKRAWGFLGDAANWVGRQASGVANAVGDAASQVASDFSDAGSNIVRDIQGRPRIEDERRAARSPISNTMKRPTPQQSVQSQQAAPQKAVPQQTVQPKQSTPQQAVQPQQSAQPKQPVPQQAAQAQPNTSFINRAAAQPQQQNPKANSPFANAIASKTQPYLNQQTQNKVVNTANNIANTIGNGIANVHNTLGNAAQHVKNVANAQGAAGTIKAVDQGLGALADSSIGKATGYDKVYNASKNVGNAIGNGIANVHNTLGNAAQQVKNKYNEMKAMPAAYGRLAKEFGRGIDSRMDAAATRAQASANDATRSLGAAANNFINTTGRKYLNSQTADKLNNFVNRAQNFTQRGINGLANRFKNLF